LPRGCLSLDLHLHYHESQTRLMPGVAGALLPMI
jgi:hypothetical protein